MTEPAPFPPVDGSQPCRDVDPELFFPKRSEPDFSEPAIATCRRCPFLHECLAYALTNDVDGVWGGTTPAQRSALRDKHGITLKVAASAAPWDTYAERNAAQILQMRQGGGGLLDDIAVALGITRKTVERHLYLYPRQKDQP